VGPRARLDAVFTQRTNTVSTQQELAITFLTSLKCGIELRTVMVDFPNEN